jgi:hypothetical protein
MAYDLLEVGIMCRFVVFVLLVCVLVGPVGSVALAQDYTNNQDLASAIANSALAEPVVMAACKAYLAQGYPESLTQAGYFRLREKAVLHGFPNVSYSGREGLSRMVSEVLRVYLSNPVTLRVEYARLRMPVLKMIAKSDRATMILEDLQLFRVALQSLESTDEAQRREILDIAERGHIWQYNSQILEVLGLSWIEVKYWAFGQRRLHEGGDELLRAYREITDDAITTLAVMIAENQTAP